MSRSATRRSLSHLFESCSHALYLVDYRQRLIYFNAACQQWLGDKADSLVGLPCAGEQDGATVDPVAAALAPPPGVYHGQTLTVSVYWASGPPPLEVRFTPFAITDQGFVLAEVSPHRATTSAPVSNDMQALRAQINRLRARQPKLDQWLPLLGEHPRTIHARRQLQLAATSHPHVAFIGVSGCGHDRLARQLHAIASDLGGSLTNIDAPLMDDDLMDLVAGPAINQLEESATARATLLIRDADQLPAQPAVLLQSWLERFPGRLRCLTTAAKPLSQRSSTAMQSLPLPLALQLSTLQIEIPSLVDRVQDIPLLATALLTRRQTIGSAAEGFSRHALDFFVAYPWPRDFLELEETVRHASRTCLRGVIQLEHLPLQMRSWHQSNPVMEQQEKPIELDRVLANIEAELIKRAIAKSNGNRSEAAKRLSISRTRLLRRISDLDLDKAETESDGNEGE